MFASLCESLGLFHVNLLFKVTIDKYNFDVCLMNFHVFNGCQCKDTLNGHKLCYKCKGFVIIYSKCLGETSCPKFRFITFDFTINTIFDFEHQFVRNGLLTLGKWHQHPNVVHNKRIIFFLMYGNLPLLCIFIFQHFFHTLRFFQKNYGDTFWLFDDDPPITKPLLMFSLGPLSSSILLWFIQTLILGWNKFFFQIFFWCKFTFHIIH